jgi:hypothetical protein
MDITTQSMPLESLPREILSYCFSLLSPEYSYWDLWRIGLVNKLFLKHIIDVKDQFQKEMRIIDPNEFKSSVVEILRTNSHFEDLASKLKAYLRRYNFPKMTDQSRNECKRCKAPVTALLQTERTYEEEKRTGRWTREFLSYCPAKRMLIISNYVRVTRFTRDEYEHNVWKKEHRLLSVEDAIVELIKKRISILQINTQINA